MTADSSTLTGSAMDDSRNMRGFQFSRLVRASGYVAVLLALASAAATFLVLIGLTPISPTPDVVFTAMMVNGALVAFLVLVIAWVVGSLVVARSRGQAGAALHIRIVALFSLVAVLPAALLAVTASITLDRGLDNWFSTRTRAIVDSSLSLAQAFAEQQAVLLRADILGAKFELERASSLHKDDPARFAVFLNSLAADHNLPGVFLITSDGSLLAQAATSHADQFPAPVLQAVEKAKQNPTQVVIVAPGPTNIIGGITMLQGYKDAFLYAARPLDPRVIRYLAMTNDNVAEYRTLEATRFGTQIAFAILFLGVTVVVLLSAIWLGIGFANRLVAPIRRLIDAAKEVSRGNLTVSVNPRNSDGDVGALGSTFNTMTVQLRTQREDLIAASNQIDARRRFTEAVLAGISAGVVGIDAQGHVTIANRTALQLLGTGEAAAIGTPIAELMPLLQPVVSAALRDARPEHRDQIVVNRDGRERTINVRVTTERGGAEQHGYVITLDDISDLVAAQRSTAWADVARRIAHEIKNPLTPIQLSAERLKRKFGRTISNDRDVFDQCTDTIIRQVGDIGRMVDEFSSFARMPKPAFVVGNLAESIRESVFLISVSQPEIDFKVDLPDVPLMGRFDARLMGQALTNVVKNATEAVLAVPADVRGQGRITVSARLADAQIVLDIVDNGIGLPREHRQRLLEPYMTTREKGTGLGLAIVAKIVEEHDGRIELLDAPSETNGRRGADIHITLPCVDGPTGDADDAPAPAAAPQPVI
jgi:two-component system nitrogen regulation sensor histidine kinase NtrY